MYDKESSQYTVRIRERIKESATHAEVEAGTVGLALEEFKQQPPEPHLVTVRFEAEDLGYEVSDPDDEDQRYIYLYVSRANLELGVV